MMRAKMQVNKITRHLNNMETVEMGCVTKGPYGPNGESEDNTFARYSPAGGLSITINNPDLVGTMNPGDKFYIDFTLAPE